MSEQKRDLYQLKMAGELCEYFATVVRQRSPEIKKAQEKSVRDNREEYRKDVKALKKSQSKYSNAILKRVWHEQKASLLDKIFPKMTETMYDAQCDHYQARIDMTEETAKFFNKHAPDIDLSSFVHDSLKNQQNVDFFEYAGAKRLADLHRPKP